MTGRQPDASQPLRVRQTDQALGSESETIRKLTLERRVTRAVKRRNRQIVERWPLFADQFATTPEAERERLARIAISNAAYFERLRAGEEAAWQRGCERREVAQKLLPAAMFQELEVRFQRCFGHWSVRQQAYYLADWWWRALRDHAPEWAQAHCPRAEDHEEWHRLRQKCPVCGLMAKGVSDD